MWEGEAQGALPKVNSLHSKQSWDLNSGLPESEPVCFLPTMTDLGHLSLPGSLASALLPPHIASFSCCHLILNHEESGQEVSGQTRLSLLASTLEK